MIVELLPVQGMHCGGCERRVEEALARLPGVGRVRAEHIGDDVELEYDPTLVDRRSLRAAIEDAGFVWAGADA